MKHLAQSLQIPWTDGPKKIDGIEGVKFTNLGEILYNALSYVFLFAGIGLLLMLLAGGFTFLTSAGDTKKLEKGKSLITNGLLGFFIIFASFWIVQALGYIFGVSTILTLFT